MCDNHVNKLTCQSITSLFLVQKFQRPALNHPFKKVWLGPVPSLATTSNAVPHFDKKVVRVVNVKSLYLEDVPEQNPNIPFIRTSVDSQCWMEYRDSNLFVHVVSMKLKLHGSASALCVEDGRGVRKSVPLG